MIRVKNLSKTRVQFVVLSLLFSVAAHAETPECRYNSKPEAMSAEKTLTDEAKQLSKTHGVWYGVFDYISTVGGCTAAIREQLDLKLSVLRTKIEATPFPPSAEQCVQLTVAHDQAKGWLFQYRFAREDHRPGMRRMPEVCETGRLKYSYEPPCKQRDPIALVGIDEPNKSTIVKLDDAAKQVQDKTDAEEKDKKQLTPDELLRQAIDSGIANKAAEGKLTTQQKKQLEELKNDKAFLQQLKTTYANLLKEVRLEPSKDTNGELNKKVEVVLTELLAHPAQPKQNQDNIGKDLEEEKERERVIAEARKAFKQDMVLAPIPPDPVVVELTDEEKQKVSQARVRSKKELRSVARTALEDFKFHRKSDLDWGSFFLESEIADEKKQVAQGEYQKLYKNWLTKRKEYQEFVKNLDGASTDQKIDALMGKLNKDYLWRYSREKAQLIDFLNGSGGNCEAETTFILATLQAVGLSPDDGQALGAQLFGDHIQAVLYNPKTKVVTNLLTGTTHNGVRAPIVQPQVLFQGYIEAAGEESPVSYEELLIANPPPDVFAKANADTSDKHPPFATNSRLKLPLNNIFASTGEIPANAIIMRGNRGSRGTSPGDNSGAAMIGAASEGADIVMYDQIKKNVADALRNPGFEKYMKAMADPANLVDHSLSKQDLAEIKQFQKALHVAVQAKGYVSPKNSDTSAVGFAPWQKNLYTDFPQINTMMEVQRNFLWGLINEPDKALQLYEAMGYEKWSQIEMLEASTDSTVSRVLHRIEPLKNATSGLNALGVVDVAFLNPDRASYKVDLRRSTERRTTLSSQMPTQKAEEPLQEALNPEGNKPTREDADSTTSKTFGEGGGVDPLGFSSKHHVSRAGAIETDTAQKGFGNKLDGSKFPAPHKATTMLRANNYALYIQRIIEVSNERIKIEKEEKKLKNGENVPSPTQSSPPTAAGVSDLIGGELAKNQKRESIALWTPALSEAVLLEKKSSSTLGLWFIESGYKEISAERIKSGEKPTVHGPNRKLIPQDLGKVMLHYLKKIPASELSTIEEPFYEDIKKHFGSMKAYIEVLEQETM